MFSKVGDNDCLFVQLRCAVYTRMYIDLLCIVPYFSVSYVSNDEQSKLQSCDNKSVLYTYLSCSVKYYRFKYFCVVFI